MNRSTNTGGADTQGTNRPEIFNVNHLPNNMTNAQVNSLSAMTIDRYSMDQRMRTNHKGWNNIMPEK
jgi:hypothetical protein